MEKIEYINPGNVKDRFSIQALLDQGWKIKMITPLSSPKIKNNRALVVLEKE